MWKLTWYQAAAIGDPRVYFAVTSEGAAGAAKRFLFYLTELFDAFLSDILVSLSLSLYLAIEPRRSRGCYLGLDFVTEVGGADVD